MKIAQYRKGVSPVLGIIIMVAVSVALVALASTIIFDLGSEVAQPADASVNTEIIGNELKISLVRNDNLDNLKIRSSSGSEIDSSDVSGQKTVTLTPDVSGKSADRFEIVGETEGGEEQILEVVDVSGTSADDNSGSSPLSACPSGGPITSCTGADTIITVNEVGQPNSMQQYNELTSLTLDDPVTVAVKNPSLSGTSSNQFAVAGYQNGFGDNEYDAGPPTSGSYAFDSDGIAEFTLGVSPTSADEKIPAFFGFSTKGINGVEILKVPPGTTTMAVSTQ